MAPRLAFQRAQQLITVLSLLLIKTPALLADSLYEKAHTFAVMSAIGIWDLALFTINILTPDIPAGKFAKPGKPGANGLWPQFVQPSETDSRAPCPGLNAMANHGILPHNGRHITMSQLSRALEETFNFSPSLTLSTTKSVAKAYGLNKTKDWIDLSDLAYHNIIEHDGSLLRQDAFFEPNQGSPQPHKSYINSFLSTATGPITSKHPQGSITVQDLADQLSRRRAESKRDNPVFSLQMTHKFFAASNASLIYEAFGGDIKTCRTVFLEEQFPKGFETSIRSRMGLTQLDFHLRSAEIALRMKEINLPPKSYN